MPLKRRYIRMERDDLAWDHTDQESDAWERSLHDSALYRKIGEFILKHKPGKAVRLHTPIRGGYNIFYRLEYDDGTSTAMRIPCKGVVKFPEEKVKYEVATMRYVAANTTIPVPKIYHWGPGSENAAGLGPFIIMDYVDHEQTMSDALKDPTFEPDDSHVLDPDVDEPKLELLYRQMADILLRLSVLDFSKIGSLSGCEKAGFSVYGRPLLQNMNSVVEFAGVAPSLLPSQTYTTSQEWYASMADMHLSQLVFQHNDAVLDEDDARDKHVARQLFRQLAHKGQLFKGFAHGQQGLGGSTFRLYSEDLRPSNVLIDRNLRVVGVIDWEFAYAAPEHFSRDPPWWLLLKSPDYWPEGYDSWMAAYEPRLATFLKVLDQEEKKLPGPKTLDRSLSQQMRESWQDKSWMVNYAARNSWAFDFIYWRYLDEKYFGPNEDGDHRVRLELLSEEELEAMERLVTAKMDQRRDRKLVEWNHDDAVAQMAKFQIGPS